MNKSELLSRISIDPDICFGKPCIRGHRIWVSLVLDLLSSGWTIPQLLEQYPGIEEADVLACIAYGAEMSRPDRDAAVTTTGQTAEWTAEERRRRREREENLPGRVRLLPPERFSDEPATSEDFARVCERGDPALTGRNSDAVHWRIVNSCSGWKQRPTTGEFYDAIHAEDPTGRQKAIISMWANEADWRELLQAWAQRAYTLQALVGALHRAGHDRCRHARLINCWRAGNRDAAR